MAREVKMPQLGERAEAGTVIRVLVSPGDHVDKDQGILEVETDKATAEVPCPYAGVVAEVKVREGDEVQSGQVIITLEDEQEAEQEEGKSGDDADGKTDRKGSSGGEDQEDQQDAGDSDSKDDVGEEGSDGSRADGEEPESAEVSDEGSSSSGGKDERTSRKQSGTGDKRAQRARPSERSASRNAAKQPTSTTGGAPRDPFPASPTVRQLALDLGVDLAEVVGTDPGGRIVEADVKARARELVRAATQARDRGPELPDFAPWGEVERIAMNPIRRATARNVARSWALVPHVSQFDQADITSVDAFRRDFGDRTEQAGKLTLTAILLKITALALRRFPSFNASVDMERGELVYKKFVHIGVAVDTEHGLLMPVIRDADQKDLVQLAAELTDMAGRARARKVSTEEMQGGSFSITNLGGLGTTNFTPIIAWPQVAILGVGRAQHTPVISDEAIVHRNILPLCITYDHRAVDGADAARFLRWIAEALEHPLRVMLGDRP